MIILNLHLETLSDKPQSSNFSISTDVTEDDAVNLFRKRGKSYWSHSGADE